MKMTQLTEFGISEWFIERWTQTIGDELLDWQADAIRHFDLFGRRALSSGANPSHASADNGSPANAQGHNCDMPKRNLIVIAPTSSGKTFLAELAMADTLMRRRKVVYVTPLKALTIQKYEHLDAVFTPLGFRVAISTRDRRSADSALRRGDFDIAVTVYEKWQNLLLTHLDLLTTVDLVVFDEPQLLLDPKRGPTVAHIFDTMATVTRAPRVLLLAARLPHVDTLAEYLNASVQRVYRRPVELRLGVLNNGRFHFREHNSTLEGDEPFPWNERISENEQPAALLNALAERGERVLVFCPSKAECHRRARMLAERRKVSVELADDDIWRLHSGPSLAPSLGGWLSCGVAVHHADLTPHQRALVESLFSGGRLSVVFCTGTLAWGVNLPATTVFVDAQKYTSGPHAGRLIPIPLDRLEFEGMAGRAGRLGHFPKTLPPRSSADDDVVGRGILWGRTPCEADLLWQVYIAPSTQHDDCPTHDAPPAFAPLQRLLNWVVSGLAHSAADARELAARSPFGKTRSSANGWPGRSSGFHDAGVCNETWTKVQATHHSNLLRKGGSAPLPGSSTGASSSQGYGCANGGSAGASPSQGYGCANGGSAGASPSQYISPSQGGGYDVSQGDVWDEAAAQLVTAGMIQVDGDGHLVPTPRGSKTAAAGLRVTSAAAIVRALEACTEFDPAIWLAFLSALPEAADARLWRSPHSGTDVAVAWQTRFGEGFSESIARRFSNDPATITVHIPNTAAQVRAMLTALVLDDWAAGTPTRDLEQRFGLPIGRLEPVADMMSWLLATTAALAETVPSARRFAAACHRAAFEVGHGIRADCTALVDALGGLLPRQTLLDLVARGWDDPGILCHRRRADLTGLAPAGIIDEMLRRCHAHIRRTTHDTNKPQTRNESNDTSTTEADTHTAITKEDPMSPILNLSGTPCRARLSIELAGRPLTLRLKSFKYLLALASARLLTRDGWIAKTDIEAGENQIKYLYQLRRELAQGGNSGNLIENDGNGHYRLTLPPQAIRFDLSRLLEHPDWDIRSQAERLTPVARGATAA